MRTTSISVFLAVVVTCMGLFGNAAAVDRHDQAPRGQVWGYIFGDFYWKANGENPGWGQAEYTRTNKNMMAGQLRRLYLGYNYKISDRFSSRVLLEANPGTLMNNGAYGVIVKQGYLQWEVPFELLHNQNVRVGLIPSPVFAFPERTWGYRSVEKEALDARGLGRSVDQGVSYSGHFDPDNNYGITLMIGNGSGTRPATDRYFEYYTSVFARLFDRRFSVEVMSNYKYLGNDNRFGIIRGFFAWENTHFTLGAEVAQVYNSVSGSQGFTDIEPLLISLFTSFDLPFITDNLRAFLRYDMFNPDRNYSDTKVYPDNFPSDLRFVYQQDLLIAGLHYAPHERVNIMPNIYMNIYDDKRPNPTDRAADVVFRTTLYYRF